MNLSDLVAQYGYPAVAVGCVLEGETVLLIAGYAAHRGLLGLPGVLAVALVSSFLGDQFWFWLGRRHGGALVERFASIRRRIPRVQAMIRAHRDALVLGVRFMVGVRVAGPVLMGWSGVPASRFLVLNLLGAGLWAGAVGGAGYAFGEVLERLLPALREVEEGVLGVLAVGAVGLHLLRRWRNRAS
jgi:membrane protein DedA with SNARE-associated domain